MSTFLVYTLPGLVLTVVVNGALLYCGHLAARRFWPCERASTRLAANGIISLALVMLIFYPLVTLGLLTRWVVAAPAIVVAIAFHAAWGRLRDVRAEGRAIAGWAKAIASSRGGLLLLGAGVLLLFAAFRAATRPPLSFDSLTYHCYFAGSWVQAGRLVHFSLPLALESAPHLPLGFEALVAWAMLPFHGDFLANFVNFPILALGVVSLYALGRELGLEVCDSSLAAGLVFGSPAVLAYLTTQYSDILAFAALSCAALFVVRMSASARHLKGWAWRDAALALAASGLAVGAKYSALPIAVLVWGIIVVRALREEGPRLRRGLAAAALGAGLLGLLGGFQYVRNSIQVGNPLYPANLRVLGVDVFRGSPSMAEAEKRLGRGTWRDDLHQIAISMTYAYGAEPTPLTWGPKLPVLVGLAALAWVLAWRRRHPRQLWAVALFAVVPTLLFYLDASTAVVVIRRFWLESTCRFLAMPVGMVAVSALVGVSLLASPLKRGIVRIGLCGFLLYDLSVMVILPDPRNVLVGVGCGLLALLAALLAFPRFGRGRRWLGVAAVVAVAVGAWGLQEFRDAKRARFLATRMDLNPLPRHWVPGWVFCDDPLESRTIALAGFDRDFGHYWFFYPLMGRRLQNRVLYAPTDATEGGRRQWTVDSGQWTEHMFADFSVWMANLRKAGVTHLFVELNPHLPLGDPRREPVEMGWAKARPELFRLADSGDHHRVYRLHWPAAPK